MNHIFIEFKSRNIIINEKIIINTYKYLYIYNEHIQINKINLNNQY